MQPKMFNSRTNFHATFRLFFFAKQDKIKSHPDHIIATIQISFFYILEWLKYMKWLLNESEHLAPMFKLIQSSQDTCIIG